MSEALVLLPGFLADGRVYADVIAGLSRKRAVMVAPLVGTSVAQMAEQVLAYAPPRFALGGHDLGAAVASEILSRAPERVSRIALICANAQAEMPQVAAAREPRMVKVRAGRMGDVLFEDMPTGALAEGPLRNQIRDYWIDMALEAGPETYLNHCRAVQRRPDFQGTLRRAKIPALVIGGRYDTLCPLRRQEFIAELMPRAELHVIENAGHLPMLEAPETVSRVIGDWLDVSAPLVLT
ncbi:alpha/beta fold hydrolase [Celeribacter sp.]|uniref:alpha/beta fold hydrolase n=1 Tax=Celeribacter sp. TaxID=1890673 RepID=UPI003A8E63D6